jgi:ABC-type enterochelin transport system substrate-binding protein
LILNYELIKAGYPTLILKRTQRQEYYDVLEAANGGNHSFIVKFIEDNLINSMQYVLEPHLKNAGTTLEHEFEKIR